MWKRPRVWVTLALLVLLNIVAWDIVKTPFDLDGYITLYERATPLPELPDTKEYAHLLPGRLFFGSRWFSYLVAAFIGFGLPFILPRLLTWLWHRIQRVSRRAILVWLSLFVICNVLAWDVIDWPREDPDLVYLYQSQQGKEIAYTYLVPRLIFHSVKVSYITATFLGFVLPFLLPRLLLWLWRAPRMLRAAGGAGIGALVALIGLLIALNVLAWNWTESTFETDVTIVFGAEERTDESIRGRPDRLYYYGLTPGAYVHSEGTSILLAFAVGEILPFMLAGALLRRRQPLGVPLPPVAGAPR